MGKQKKVLKDIDGIQHKLEKVHSNKVSVKKHAEQLKKSGKKVKIVNGKDKNGKPVCGVYIKVEDKKKVKKKKS